MYNLLYIYLYLQSTYTYKSADLPSLGLGGASPGITAGVQPYISVPILAHSLSLQLQAQMPKTPPGSFRSRCCGSTCYKQGPKKRTLFLQGFEAAGWHVSSRPECLKPVPEAAGLVAVPRLLDARPQNAQVCNHTCPYTNPCPQPVPAASGPNLHC